ncbi:MAG: DNA polymerase III subunit beta [Deltaproteobacteria bacterium]|nr:DNA polymerase III subunit beta [Deltaproteobacteria bacterium]MBW1993312.1 DNA polymerase III subunit beta [Deltaproteobacteria bacterium]MBW2153228.1 DNA polymerase III subunit beta [Deltaproteobacteria bacterium]
MKFTVQKADILDVLSKIQGLTGRKSNLAITSNVLIKAGGSKISITATDLETGFEGTYPAKVDSEGVIVISSRKLFEIVRDFPIESINIHEVEKRWIMIGNQNIEYHIVGMNPDDFPEIPQITEVGFFNMTSEALKRMIDQTTVIASSSDDKRAHIIGVFIEKIDVDGQKLIRMVSTDGSRLSKVDYALDKEDDPDLGNGILVPKKGLAEVGKFLEPQGPIQVGYKDNHFIVKKGMETIIIRLLEGEFPEYSDIVEKNKGNVLILDRIQFQSMLKRMSIFSSESYKGVIFNIYEDKLQISSTNPDIGDSKEIMNIEFSGDPVEVAFNPRYFIETLGVMEDENILLHIINEENPCIVEGDKNKTYLSVIMPMRI